MGMRDASRSKATKRLRHRLTKAKCMQAAFKKAIIYMKTALNIEISEMVMYNNIICVEKRGSLFREKYITCGTTEA